MARIRTFKPEFLRHEELQELENKYHNDCPMFVFLGLWSVCDKQGVFQWKPKSLKLDIYPFLEYDMEKTLSILLDNGFISRFETEDGNVYGFVINFEKHQRITGDEGKNPPKYPAPPSDTVKTQLRHSQDTSEDDLRHSQENGKGKGIKEREEETEKGKEDFSLSGELNPAFGNFSQRLEKLRAKYNDMKIGPPFKKTAFNLNPAESSDLMKIMQVYDDEISMKAMENYEKIKKSAEHDPGGCVYHGFISFMVRGVEKFCDEANPFESFKRKDNGVRMNNKTAPPNGLADKKPILGLKPIF